MIGCNKESTFSSISPKSLLLLKDVESCGRLYLLPMSSLREHAELLHRHLISVEYSGHYDRLYLKLTSSGEELGHAAAVVLRTLDVLLKELGR